ncbi:MAG: hypothetical protein AAF662_08800 [Pseudomonadota bacterium]
MATNYCAIKKDVPATVSCVVCGRYFCDEAVTFREFEGPICHECSGEIPSDAKPLNIKTAKMAREEILAQQAEAANSQRIDESSVLVPALEWLVVAACVAFIGYGFASNYLEKQVDLQLTSSEPIEVATYCLRKLDSLSGTLAPAALLTTTDVREVCVPPLEIDAAGSLITITTPDPRRFGYSKLTLLSDASNVRVSE